MSCRTKEQESIRKFPGKCSGKRRKNRSRTPKAQPQEEAQPQVSYREERQVVEQVWEQPGLQEISDELERLSGRYQTRMEEWLDDQSAI